MPIIAHKRTDAHIVNMHHIETASNDEFCVCIYQHLGLSVFLSFSLSVKALNKLSSALFFTETSSTIKVECVCLTADSSDRVC